MTDASDHAPQSPRTATVALIVNGIGPALKVEAILSDEREINYLEALVTAGERSPLERILEMRQKQSREDDEFGDYVEELLSRPFLRPEVQEHAVQWLKSKLRIEQFQKQEAAAAKVIAEYACTLIKENPDRVDFVLKGPKAEVRVRIFPVAQPFALAA